MAKWGINWGAPDHTEKAHTFCFKERLKIDGELFLLKGLADSDEDADYMVAIASNGRRKIEKVPGRGGLIGIYIN